MKRIEKRIQNKSLFHFEVKANFGLTIGTTKAYWEVITKVKHPSLYGKEELVKQALADPDEIRVSKKTKDILLFYKKLKNLYVCVVVRIFKKTGFIVTAYKTDKIKEGDILWKR